MSDEESRGAQDASSVWSGNRAFAAETILDAAEPSEPWQDPQPCVSPDGRRWHRKAMSDEKYKPRSRAVYDAETKVPQK